VCEKEKERKRKGKEKEKKKRERKRKRKGKRKEKRERETKKRERKKRERKEKERKRKGKEKEKKRKERGERNLDSLELSDMNDHASDLRSSRSDQHHITFLQVSLVEHPINTEGVHHKLRSTKKFKSQESEKAIEKKTTRFRKRSH